MEKKLNLDEILNMYSSYGEVNDNPRAVVMASEAKLAMVEFGKQLLELASENAWVEIETCMGQKTGDVWVNKESIIDTINQVI